VGCGIISSCQSAATSEIVKRFWLRTHVRSAVVSITTFAFLLMAGMFIGYSSRFVELL